MNQQESIHGLACPNCGGMVPVPEGQVIVLCPYCDLRSIVRGERGVERYQVPLDIDEKQAIDVMKKFLSSSRAITGRAAKQAKLTESFIAFLPFWVFWAHVLGWVFGKEIVGSGEDVHYEPREVKIAEDMDWNAAACDVGEFGVDSVPLADQLIEPFDADFLHDNGMVFEPLGSLSDAKASAEAEFDARVEQMAGLDKVEQVFVRQVRRRTGLVYYPLWVLRYLYRGRAYQVVVDGYTGKLLYGNAPGNTYYRAAILVGGMALGAFMLVDVTALLLYLAFQVEGAYSISFFAGGLAVFGIGIGLMRSVYRKFRYGEEYEYREHRKRWRHYKLRKVGDFFRASESAK